MRSAQAQEQKDLEIVGRNLWRLFIQLLYIIKTIFVSSGLYKVEEMVSVKLPVKKWSLKCLILGYEVNVLGTNQV